MLLLFNQQSQQALAPSLLLLWFGEGEAPTPQPPPPEIHTGGAWSWRAQRFEPRVESLFARSILTAPPTLGRPELSVRLGPEQQRRRRAALIAALH